VGDLTGRGLDIVNSQVINWGEVKNIPNLQVLSRKTGFMRPYGENPYGTYEQNTELMFPVKNKDQSLPPKTIMVAGNYQGVPFALERLALFSETPIELAVGEETLTITVDGGKILVNNAIGQLVPTYNSMWFSWANHWRTDDAVIWSEAIDNTPHIRLPLEANNKVNLIEYLSYGCSYCQQIHNALDAALKETPEVNLELKHFIVYEAFMPIHEAQVCADEQNQGYAFHDQYFKNYYPQKSVATGNQIAQELGLNKTDFASCLASNRPSDVINRDMQEGIALGVTGTPTLLVEGPNTPIRIFSARTKPSILAELATIN